MRTTSLAGTVAPAEVAWRPRADPGTPRTARLGRAGEPLFVAGALNDQVAVAEADRGTDLALLVPELGDLLLELLVLRGERGVVPLRELVQDVGTPVGKPVDLLLDL